MPYPPVRLVQAQNFVPKLHTSASRLALFMRCQRQWGFEKLLGLREDKERPWLTFGKEVEYYQQKYLEGFSLPQDVEAGRRALASLHLLPDPNQNTILIHQDPIKVNTGAIVPSIEPFDLRGAKDLISYYACQWSLYDYKTTRGNTRRKGGEWDYVKTQDQLLSDVQANFYAWDVMVNRSQSLVPGRWVYTLTDLKKHPNATCTDVEFTYDATLVRMRKFVELADWHRDIARQYTRAPFDVNSLPPNGETCETFGGCPFRPAVGGPCKQPGRSLGEMMMNPNGVPPTDIETMLEQRKAQGQQAGAPAGYAPMPPPQGGVMAPPGSAMPGMHYPAPPAPPTFQPGTIMNGHQLQANGQWIPVQAPPPPPPMAPPTYAAPPAPHLPPEAYAPPPPPQHGPPAGPPSLPAAGPPMGPPGVLPTGAHPAAPLAPPTVIATGKKGKAAPAPSTDDRTQFIRACALACSTGHALTPAQAKSVVDYASQLWDYLQAAGA